MKTKNHPFTKGEPLFPDVASYDDFERVARYFGEACTSIYSVYYRGADRFVGEVELFSRGEVFSFEIIEIEGILYLLRLETESLIL